MSQAKLPISSVIATVGFVALSIFLALVLFIKPAFLEPVTSWIHNFGRFSIGPLSFSLGGIFAIMLFFGLIGVVYTKNHKKQ